MRQEEREKERAYNCMFVEIEGREHGIGRDEMDDISWITASSNKDEAPNVDE